MCACTCVCAHINARTRATYVYGPAHQASLHARAGERGERASGRASERTRAWDTSRSTSWPQITVSIGILRFYTLPSPRYQRLNAPRVFKPYYRSSEWVGHPPRSAVLPVQLFFPPRDARFGKDTRSRFIGPRTLEEAFTVGFVFLTFVGRLGCVRLFSSLVRVCLGVLWSGQVFEQCISVVEGN